MRWVMFSVASLAAIAMIGASVGFNVVAATNRADDVASQIAWLAAVVGSVLITAACPVAFANALRRWTVIPATLIACLFAVLLTFNVGNALSVAHGSRHDTATQRVAQADAYSSAKMTLANAEHALVALPVTRTAAEIRAALDARPVNADVWRRTSGCLDVTKEPSREACAPVFALRAELATAESRDRLIADRDAKAAAFAALPAPRVADPVVAGLVSLAASLGWPLSADAVGPWWSLLTVLAIELGAALSPLAATYTLVDAQPRQRVTSRKVELAQPRDPSPALRPLGSVAQFIAANLEAAPGNSLKLSTLLAPYVSWCKSNGSEPVTELDFLNAARDLISEAGGKVIRRGSSLLVSGVTLRAA